MFNSWTIVLQKQMLKNLQKEIYEIWQQNLQVSCIYFLFQNKKKEKCKISWVNQKIKSDNWIIKGNLIQKDFIINLAIRKKGINLIKS